MAVQRSILRVERSGAVLADRLEIADGWWGRFRGLMLRGSLAVGEGIQLVPGSSIHTHFMRFPIDVLYLDKEQQVVKIVAALKPWRFSAGRGAHSTVELPGGHLADLDVEVGDRVTLEAVGNTSEAPEATETIA